MLIITMRVIQLLLLQNLNIPNNRNNKTLKTIIMMLKNIWISMISLRMVSWKLVNRVSIRMISYQQMKAKVRLALNIRIIIRILKSKIISIIWISRNPSIRLRCGRQKLTIMKKQTMFSRSFKVLQ